MSPSELSEASVPSRPVRVLIADSETICRIGMRGLLEEEGAVEVVGEAGTGAVTIEEARRLRPDVLIMDPGPPSMDGIEVTNQIHRELPETRVLLMTVAENAQQLVAGIRAGAVGYVLKTDSPEAIKRAVVSISSGAPYIGPQSLKRVLDSVVAAPGETPRGGRRRPHELTPRERGILELLGQGLRSRDIASRLGISERTVGNHITSMFDKFNVHDRGQLVLHAVREGLLQI